MIKEVLATGKDVAEAKENARAALGVSALDEVDVKFEIVHMGSKGIFGIIGVKPAQVKASIEIPEREERRKNDKKKGQRPERKPEAKKPEVKTAEAKKPEAKEKSENEETASAPTQNSKKKKKNKKKSGGEGASNKPQSPVIPETELKMERREVESGEDMSFDFINTLLSDIGLDATAELYSCEDGTRRINIIGADASTLIGHHGDTLDALQYLANLASARKNSKGERDKSRVTIDIEGYRAKREATLRALARRMAAKALRNKRSVMLEPMSAYERRIIHSEIQGIEGVSTNSIGSENNRKIVIFLTDKKPEGIFEEENEVETTTSLREEFAPDAEDVNVGAVDVSVSVDEAEDETVAVETTVPDEAEELVIDEDDDGIK